MSVMRSKWAQQVMLLSQWYSVRLARTKADELRHSMSNDQWQDLLNRVDENSKNIENSNGMPSGPMKDYLFSPQSMLCHPLLVHHIRPAKKFVSAAGYDASGVPIITNPRLTFGGQALKLEASGLKIAELPLGLVFLFRELSIGIVGLHNAIQHQQTRAIPALAVKCGILSKLIYQPAPLVFAVSSGLFNDAPISQKIFATQTMQFLTAFLILHEVGHIHDDLMDPLSEQDSIDYELRADVFAMRCLFATKKDNAKFAVIRQLVMVQICHLMTLMELEFEASGARLSGYPTFNARRLNLLHSFEQTDGVTRIVMNAIADFAREVRSAFPAATEFARQFTDFRHQT